MDTSNNNGRYILSALKTTGTNKQSGFVFNCYSANQFYLYGSATGANINNVTFGTRLGNGWRTSSGTKTYTFDFTYTPSPNEAITAVLTPVVSGSNTYNSTTTQMQYFPDSLEDTSIVLGGIGINTKDINNMKVLEFKVSFD